MSKKPPKPWPVVMLPVCFICGNRYICEHREWDLISYYLHIRSAAA